MPDLFEKDSSIMSEERIELAMLARIDSEQRALAARVDGIAADLQQLTRDLGRIEGRLAAPSTETPTWVTYFVYPACVLIASCMAGALITLLVEVNGIEIFIHNNGGAIAALRLEKVTPSDPQEAEQILAQSKKEKIKISSEVVEETGNKFIDASNDDPTLWAAALRFIDYRTFLNGDLTPNLPNPRRIPPNTKVGNYAFALHVKPREGTEQTPSVFSLSLTTSGTATSSEASARLESLSSPQAEPPGIARIVIEGRTDILVLDGEYMKNVTIINVDVNYNGGPVKLENVTFINCRFHFINQQPSRELVRSILASASVNFFSPKIG